jgi:hypothetical protein
MRVDVVWPQLDYTECQACFCFGKCKGGDNDSQLLLAMAFMMDYCKGMAFENGSIGTGLVSTGRHMFYKMKESKLDLHSIVGSKNLTTPLCTHSKALHWL